MSGVVIFQTVPASRSSSSWSESTPLLDDHRPWSHSPVADTSPLKAVIIAPVIISVINYMLLALCETYLVTILPVYLASAPLSLTPREIGIFTGGMGIVGGAFQVLWTAKLVERWGAKRIYQLSICAFFPLCALFPIAVSMATDGDTKSWSWNLWLPACIGLMLVPVKSMAFSKRSSLQYSIVDSPPKSFLAVIFLFISSAAPTRAARGTTNGVAQTMASLMRTVGPACATSLYAVSVEHQLLSGQLVYVVFLLITAVTLLASFLLPMTPRAQDT